MYFMIFVVIAFVGFLAYAMFTYNSFISHRNYVKEAFSTMDVYLKKRWDLIPNLVETVKGYTEHEKEVFEKITEMRNLNYNNLSNSEKMNINSELSLGLSKLIAVAENYPDLKANQNFSNLQNELSKIEEDIATSRKYYNGTVREYNTAIEMFPAVVLANMFNFKSEKLYEIDTIERENVKVSF